MNDIKKIVKKSGTSFFWSMRMLPQAKRQAMYTLYAFCRHIDDIADEPGDINEKLELLNIWRQEMDNIYDKKVPATDIGRKIYKNCMRFKLPKDEFIKLINTVAAELVSPMHGPNLPQLMHYCDGVAVAPGNLSMRIFGFEDEKIIRDLAKSLGTALQLTNILRDVKEDADIGRLYIPHEFLQKAGVNSTDPKTVVIDKNLSVAREELAKIAQEEYKKSSQIIKTLNKKLARPVRIIFTVYKRYFEIMNTRGWEIISPKPKLGKFNKFFIILKAYFNR